MNNYNHTIYENYSQHQLTALFGSENWQSLSFAERMNACQEVENRYAAENNVQPCTVTHQPMDGACYGWQSGNTICLNSYLVADGQFCTQYTDQNGNVQTVRTDALAPGWNTLDTVYHEGTHGIQEQTGRMPSTYISPEMDGDLYRIQGIEKEAYAVGQAKTLDALSSYEKNVGHLDASRNDYIASVRNDSFQSALSEAARNYNDPNIEQTLQTVISDRENNITRENTTESYDAINNLCDTYGIHSSTDISQEASAGSGIGLTSENVPNEHSAQENLSTSAEHDDGFTESASSSSDQTISSDELQDGADESSEHVEASSESLDDGAEENSDYTESSTEESDDGSEEDYQDTSTQDFDDGYSTTESTVDYGGSEQSYSDDGMDSGGGYDSGSSGGAESSVSDGMDNSD